MREEKRSEWKIHREGNYRGRVTWRGFGAGSDSSRASS